MRKSKGFFLLGLVGLFTVLLVLALLVEKGGKAGTVLTPDGSLIPVNPETPTIEFKPFRYGVHYPNGIAAVDYIFSSDGMWKEMNPIDYAWNYYENCAESDHPFGKGDLIAAANGTRLYTARDANCHLLLDWNWVVGLTKKLFRKVAFKARLNYILNWLFFIDGVIVMWSGILISEIALPLFGIQPVGGHTWKTIHSVSADISLFILAIHTALHWDWIVTVVKRYLIQPLRRTGHPQREKPGQREVEA